MNFDYRLRVDSPILSSFPAYSCMVVYAQGLTNTTQHPYSTELLARAQEDACRSLNGEERHPHLQAWRNAFAAFGAKPSKYLCSAEALAKRAGKGIPQINAIVDIYNAVSLRHLMPVGGEDWAKLAGPLILCFSDGTEPFISLAAGLPATEHPEPGEPVWCDPQGVTCRRWNWRQSVRTAITPATEHAYFVLDALTPFAKPELEKASSELIEHLSRLSPA